MKKSLSAAFIVVLFWGILFFLPAPTSGDEGMWTFDNPPAKRLRDRYGFEITREWLDHIRLSSLRFNNGGSGSFISSTGLVLTNHHVALGQLQKVSTEKKNYVADGFYARTPAEEMKSPDLELNQLISMEDVTGMVQEGVKAGMRSEEAFKSRRAAIARIERESMDATGLRSDVVTLYGGAEYRLYRYKKYTDVRLVFAPEQQTAFFGGDSDNFTYPRYDLDMAVFRIYENGKPVNSRDYLKWNAKGAIDGELVFVSGNPGSTDRMQTMAQIENQRDYFLPSSLEMLKKRLAVLEEYSARGPEQAREAAGQIFGIQNSIKALTGEYEGLQNEEIMTKKQREEEAFRNLVDKNPELKQKYGNAWSEIERADKLEADRRKEIEYRSLRGSRLASIALTIVQYVEEVKKPDGERLNGYHDSQLASLRFRLLSPAPVYPNLEIALLAGSFEESLAELGAQDPFIKAALNGMSPSAVAKRVIAGTGLANADARKALLAGGEAAVETSTDPAIELARRINPIIVEMRRWDEDKVQSVLSAGSEKLGKARFAVYGKTEYPDATFTPRLSYGTVMGYPMNGTLAPPKTTFYGLFDRADGFNRKPPFNLAANLARAEDKINLSTPLNFVSTCDIVGGNSGSPVINRNGEIIGLIFDGNIESLVGNFIYDERTNRAVAVDTAAMTEALRKVYGAGALADEIEGSAQH